MSTVRLASIAKHYGSTVAVHELDLDVADGELVTLLGPSGCGKTTTLRMVAGLIEPTAGRIWFDDQDVTFIPPRARNIGFVFQTPALFPHLTVSDNVAFGLSVKGRSKPAIRERVAEMLAMVGLPEYGARMPAQLSGGQQQRVALARVLATDPRVLLFDEPLSALDRNLRDTLKYEVLVVDEKKAKVRSIGGLEGRLTLSPKANGETPPQTVTYAILHAVDVMPGHFEFRVSATSAKLSKGGSAYLEFDVPDFRSAPIVLGSIVLGYAEGARVPIAPPPAPAPALARGRGPGPAPAPPPAPKLPFPPTLDRVFTPSDILRVYVEGTARSATGLTATIEIVGADGKSFRALSTPVSAVDPVRIGGDVPLQGLAAGAYVLRVTLSGDGHRAARDVGFAVR